jgi:hypothetical protein
MGKILLLKTTYLPRYLITCGKVSAHGPAYLDPSTFETSPCFLAGFQKMPLSDLPNEILLNIVKFACSSHNISSFCRGSRRLHQVINPYLYLQKVIKRDSTALFCGARPGHKVTVLCLVFIRSGSQSQFAFPCLHRRIFRLSAASCTQHKLE